MILINTKVTDLKDFKAKKKLEERIVVTNNFKSELNITVNEESLFKDLRTEKRREKGLLWD